MAGNLLTTRTPMLNPSFCCGYVALLTCFKWQSSPNLTRSDIWMLKVPSFSLFGFLVQRNFNTQVITWEDINLFNTPVNYSDAQTVQHFNTFARCLVKHFLMAIFNEIGQSKKCIFLS